MVIYAITYLICHLGISLVLLGATASDEKYGKAAVGRLISLALILPVFGRVAGWW